MRGSGHVHIWAPRENRGRYQLDPPYPDGQACITCGEEADRYALLLALREAIRARRRLPPSPWTPGERAFDTD